MINPKIKYLSVCFILVLNFLKPLHAEENQQTDVIVVGAGISGIVAAQYLQQAGLKVVVLEAKSRLGGRIVTEKIQGIPIELGAAWFQNISGSLISMLAKNFDLPTVHVLGTEKFFTGLGVALSPKEQNVLEQDYRAFQDFALSQQAAQVKDQLLSTTFSDFIEQSTIPPVEKIIFTK